MNQKVFHVISELNVGGAERQLLLILPHLNQTFANHVVCLIGEGIVGKQLEAHGITVHYLHGNSRADTTLIPKLQMLIRTHRPKVIIGYLIFADLLTRFIAKQTNIPYLSSQRSSHTGRLYLFIPDILTASLITGYTVQTEHANKFFRKLPIANKKARHTIPNAVAPAAQPTSTHQEKLTITCIATLKKGKGHVTLLQAVENFQFPISNFQLLLAGDGPLRPSLEHLANNLRLKDTVQFLGLVPDTAHLLQHTDIFVLPTEGEGMSNALLEAMAAGLPCVTTDIPANREVIIHNKTGILVTPNNPTALADALRLLLDNSNLRHNLGAQAREHVSKHHDPHVISEKWAAVISLYAQ